MTNPPRQQILRRTVRFSINHADISIGEHASPSKPTTFGLGRYDEITLSINGQPDPQTGYIVSIHELDTVVRDQLIPIIAQQVASDAAAHPGILMPPFWDAITNAINHTLHAIRWHLSPYHSIEMSSETQSSNAVLLRERFEFAAAHRLHAPTMSDAQNANYFGKCNNPSGHGHNYQLEPAIRIPIDLLDSKSFQLEIEQAVNTILLDQLDHKFLNIDCPWFDQSIGGVIPSVENIARICYQQLAPEIAKIAPGIKLVSMTAWETQKTSSIYPADAH